MRAFLGIAAALSVSLVSLAASANSGGLAGYTGKPNINAPQGESCNQCHSGGTTPTVSLNGPASLAAGSSAEYTLVVQTGLTRAAGGVAATDGVVLTPGTGFRDSFGEMVQSAPLAISGGQATFRFTVKAPASGTTLRLWAVGLAANNSGGQTGDRAAHVIKDVAITGGTAPKPDAGSGTGGTTTDAGAGTSSSSSSSSGDPGGTSGTSSTSSSGGTSGGTDDPDNAADPGDDDGTDAPASSGGTRTGSKTAPGAGSTAQSCAASPIGSGSGAMLVGIAAIAIAAGARRRRPRA